MDKKELYEKLVKLFDKELDEVAKKTHHGDTYTAIDFNEACEDLKTEEPAYNLILDYFVDVYIYDVFNFCGCGRNGAMLDRILKVLDCFNNEDPPFFGYDQKELYKKAFPSHDDDDKEFMLKWLDSVGLTDHGTSVYACWLTEKGILLRELLHEYENEDES